jgi:5'-nucleotidase
VNAPVPETVPGDGRPEMAITEPSTVYMMDASQEEGRVTLHDRIWERMGTGDVPDAEGTDRRAIVEGQISVSPLTAPHTTEHHEALDGLAETYPSSDE